MALNIDKTKNLTSDIYGINAYVNEIKKKFTPEISEDTQMLGIFGYTGQMFSDLLQNTIVMASEFSNESIATKAKFEKNIIAHALGLGITDINAVPAQFDVLLTFIEDDIIKWWKTTTSNIDTERQVFIFDKDTPIYIGDHCFHVDYDIEICKIKLSNNKITDSDYAYTARYLIGDKNNPDNPVSDITNPYLPSPVKMRVNGMNVIFTKCTLHQVKKSTIYKKVLSDNSIASKTVTFEFEGQLAAFDIDVKEGNNDPIHLIPVHDGLTVSGGKYPHFYYSYLDSNTIRIKFDRMSYAPRINSEVRINVQTTEGEGGNFVFNPEVYPGFSFDSDRYGYSNIGCEIRPVTGESAYGTNKKSIEDLKKLIPKEAISRGSITSLTDLENFFNMLNTNDCKLYFYKKRDNALERLYYSFIVMRDKMNVIVPTNTIDIVIDPKKMQTEEGSNKLIFGRNLVVKLTDGKGYVCNSEVTEDPDYSNSFYYIIPYNFIINVDPLYSMYYLSVIDAKKFLDFSYINSNCMYQYISTSIHWNRNYINNPDTYTMSISFARNVENKHQDDMEEPLCIAVFYNEKDVEHRWAKGVFKNYDRGSSTYSYEFKFTTKDFIDSKNRIKIETGMYEMQSDKLAEHGSYFEGNTKCVIHILSKQDENSRNDDNYTNLCKLIPGLEGYILSNSYTIVDGIDFFYDYSEIISSTVVANMKLEEGEDGDKHPVLDTYTVKNVPMVKYDYFDDDDKTIDFCKELVQRKVYIDYAIQVLEDAFGMDFKFFNTYGPSKLFTIDNDKDTINNTSLSITFNVKLKKNYDTNIINDMIADIKDYIEDINEISSLHMPNLVTAITTKYQESLVYFEFMDMNGYGPGVQHLYSMGMPSEVVTPEFLNIEALPDGTPSIMLNMM